ncbi:MAG TPA: ABC transporter ATP-binding protein [Bryobacteraceae bacterium]|jgi:ABC-type polysaccharide/polyol phosphate transport system ATPase subunit
MAALVFDQVVKSFPHHSGARLLRDRIADLIHPSRAQRIEVLKGVSFEVPSGDGLGLIGPNGAGKSTILNLACGLSAPDSGRIEVHGRVAALLELGSGFHPDLTGAENVRINAAMIGLSRRETSKRFEEIVEFSGVRDFIHEPLRTYSSGMTMRLAFSVAVHVDPDVLVIDEVIGVGDQAFAAKCLERMRQFQAEGKTILLATHSVDLMSQLCQHALWIERGRVVTSGPVGAVVAAYKAIQPPAAVARAQALR